MAGKSDRKARQRQKRQQQRRQALRVHGGSPYRHAARSGELVACYVNEGWKENGMATVFVLRRTITQGLVMAAFLVDIWCAGLKDAWGWLNATMDEFRDRVLHPPGGRPDDLKRVDLAVVRQLVAGGIRFAEQNGFRLPPRHQRWTAMLGEMGDIDEADLADFGANGKLRWVGSETDLRKRLVGCSVQEFMQREDVECILGMDDFTLIDDDEQALEETANQTSAALAKAVRQWCFATGRAPEPRLEEAVDIFFEALLALEAFEDDESLPNDEDDRIAPAQIAEVDDHLERLLSVYEDEQHRAELRDAIDQVRDYMSQCDDPEKLFASLYLGALRAGAEASDPPS